MVARPVILRSVAEGYVSRSIEEQGCNLPGIVHTLTAATWSDIAVAVGTFSLAVVTLGMVRQTRRLVEDAEQPVIVPAAEGVNANYQWSPSALISSYRLPIRNVGKGVAIIQEEGGALLVDSQQPLHFGYPGSVILGPGEGAVLEVRGGARAVPVFTIRLTYSDVSGKRLSQTEVPYDQAREGGADGNVDVVALRPTYRAKVKP